MTFLAILEVLVQKAPWEIAIEIAARETILNYEENSVGADALKNAAIMPKEN